MILNQLGDPLSSFSAHYWWRLKHSSLFCLPTAKQRASFKSESVSRSIVRCRVQWQRVVIVPLPCSVAEWRCPDIIFRPHRGCTLWLYVEGLHTKHWWGSFHGSERCNQTIHRYPLRIFAHTCTLCCHWWHNPFPLASPLTARTKWFFDVFAC